LPDDAGRERPRLLERLGLHRPELRAWALYDWANSAFVLGIQTTIFPLYFVDVLSSDVAADPANERFGWATTCALAITALMAPVLGAIADYAGVKKRFLAMFLSLGIGATAALFLVQQGQWLLGAGVFALANVGAQGSFVFYDSLLPHLARDPDEMDRTSSAGYALGYLGSSILFAVLLVLILRPDLFGLPAGEGLSWAEATLPRRLAFLAIAAWWLLFALPLFLRVPEPAPRLERGERPGENALRVAFSRLGETLRELRTYRQALLLLVAFIIYNDGIGTIIRMAGVYGRGLGIGQQDLLVALLIAQLVGIPFTFLIASLAGRFGAKRMILFGLTVYVGVTISAFFMRSAGQFYVLAAVVGLVQGGCQALSRSLFASMIPKHKSSEFFSFYGVLDKFAGMLGPASFALTIRLTGSSRYAILSLLLFFLVGGSLLTRVRVEEGRQRARRAERELVPAPSRP
jgi:UMF1 family MFS transporter